MPILSEESRCTLISALLADRLQKYSCFLGKCGTSVEGEYVVHVVQAACSVLHNEPENQMIIG